MKKRSDTAKEKKNKNIQTKSGRKKSNKKKKKNSIGESVPSTRTTRSKTVNSGPPRAASNEIKSSNLGSVSSKSGGNKSNKKGKENCVVESIPPSRVTRSKTVVNSNEVKSSHSGSDSLKQKEKKEEKKIVERADFVRLENFQVDTICLAKQKYSCPWPARVLKVEEKKVLVYFFGDKRVGYVQTSEIYDLVKSSRAIQLILLAKKKPPGFVTGLAEIESLFRINSNQSLLNSV